MRKKLSDLYARHLSSCSIRVCLRSVFVKISEIRRLRSAKGDEEAETEIRDNYENYEVFGNL